MFTYRSFFYFLEKMSNFEPLLFVLVGSIVGRSGAISCYSCQYASTLPEWTTCAEPFDATNAPTCTGSVCSIGFGNYTGSPSKYFVIVFCHKSK